MIGDHVGSTTAERLEQLVRRHLRFLKTADSLAADCNLGELGLDSMASVELLVEMEEHFGVQISDEHLAEDTFQCLNTLLELLSKSSAVR